MKMCPEKRDLWMAKAVTALSEMWWGIRDEAGLNAGVERELFLSCSRANMLECKKRGWISENDISNRNCTERSVDSWQEHNR